MTTKSDKAKNKGGRPPVFDQEVIKAEILDWIVCGKSLSAYLKQEGKPSYSLVCRWLREDAEFVQNYARAREEQADTFADELMEIADEEPPCDDNGKTDAAWIAWQKNRIEARKWIASKMKPKRYGDRQQIDQNVQMEMSIEQVDLRLTRVIEKLCG